MKKTVYGLFSALLLILNSSNGVAADTITIQNSSVQTSVEFDGRVHAVNQGTLAAQTSGRIVALYVDVNDRVEKGDVLLEISSSQQSSSLDAALAQLGSAKAQNSDSQAQLKRFQRLLPDGAVSLDRLETAQAQAKASKAAVKAAQAAVNQAKESLGYTSIKAPYSGVMVKRHIELGETVSPGTQLLTGMSLRQLRVETELPQRYLHLVNSANQFSMVTPSGEELTPISYTIFNYADPKSHTFKVRLDLPPTSEDIYPGMWMKTKLKTTSINTILIPESAIVRRGELTAVYRVNGEKKVLNPIRLGKQYESSFEVLSGLELGDLIVNSVFAGMEK